MPKLDAVPKHVLPMHDLAERHRGLTSAIGASYAEAACVCLDRHHQPPVEIDIDGVTNQLRAEASWDRTDERTRAAWANETDATEAGAYACVLGALELAHQLVAVRRAETRSGADYYVAGPGDGVEDLESCYRLEVSGVDAGSEEAVRRRLSAKVRQACAGASNLPAIAGVVGFKALLVTFRTVEDE